MQMPKIDGCEVAKCAYNSDGKCHALAITIGDGAEPRCDTFLDGAEKGGDPQATGSVGACKVSACSFNKNLECNATSIHVAAKSHPADCTTFKRN